MKIIAEYHDGESSQRKQAELVFNDDGSIELCSENGSKLYQLEDVSFSSRLGNTPRALKLPDGSVCYINENDLVDAFLKKHGAHTVASIIHLLESRIIYVLSAVIFTAVFSWAMVVYGIPFMSSEIAYNLPADVDRALGTGTLEALDKIVFSESSLATGKRASLLSRFDDMKLQIEGGQDYKIVFRHGGEVGANAFALPSGIIILTDELVELSEDNDEVISVIAHEIGHLVHRHSVRMVLQNSAVAVLVATITGDPFSTSSLVVALPTLLVNSKYSREFEKEADGYAYDYLVANNIETLKYANILERITEGELEDGAENYLSSHPATDDRLQRFR